MFEGFFALSVGLTDIRSAVAFMSGYNFKTHPIYLFS